MQLTKLSDNSKQTEQQYRQLKGYMNYSGLRLYATNRSKFYKEYILGEVKEKDQSISSLIGDIAHTLLADNGEFDNKFILTSVNPPSGQMLELVDNLYKRTLKSLDNEGRQTQQFETLFMDAFNETKYDRDLKEVKFKGKTLEKVVEMFSGTDAELYYKELLNCTGKTVVTVNNIQSAERLVEQLKNHEYTRDIINLQTGNGIEVFNELVVVYDIDGIPYKSMIDKLVVDHNKKIITPYDYKCTWSNEDGFEYSYLKNGYWLQAGLYDLSIWHWKREHGLEYKVNPMHYIAADTTSNNAPVIYKLTPQDIEMAKHGFTVRGKKYPGVLELQEALKWHNETGIWNTNEKIHKAGGVIGIDINYE